MSTSCITAAVGAPFASSLHAAYPRRRTSSAYARPPNTSSAMPSFFHQLILEVPEPRLAAPDLAALKLRYAAHTFQVRPCALSLRKTA
jgi:hypothetical protein